MHIHPPNLPIPPSTLICLSPPQGFLGKSEKKLDHQELKFARFGAIRTYFGQIVQIFPDICSEKTKKWQNEKSWSFRARFHQIWLHLKRFPEDCSYFSRYMPWKKRKKWVIWGSISPDSVYFSLTTLWTSRKSEIWWDFK